MPSLVIAGMHDAVSCDRYGVRSVTQMYTFVIVILALGYLFILIGGIMHTLQALATRIPPRLLRYSDVDETQHEGELGRVLPPPIARHAEADHAR
jgi:hypothetical protein